MDESLKNLPPKERVKALRDLQEKKKRELEELEKKHQEEMESAEDAVRKSLDEAEEDERQEEERLKALQDQIAELEEEEKELEEQSLEQRLRGEQEAEEMGAQYRTGLEGANREGSYTPINEIVDDLNRLQYTDNWSSAEQDLYQQRKEELYQTEKYANTLGDEVLEQIDTAQSIMNKLGYKHESP